MNSVSKQLSLSDYMRPIFHGVTLAFFLGLPFALASLALDTAATSYLVDEQDTVRTLEDAGYNVVSVGGGVHPWLRDDLWDEYRSSYATKFNAIGANGKLVSGYVENGNWWHSSRVVFDHV